MKINVSSVAVEEKKAKAKDLEALNFHCKNWGMMREFKKDSIGQAKRWIIVNTMDHTKSKAQ